MVVVLVLGGGGGGLAAFDVVTDEEVKNRVEDKLVTERMRWEMRFDQIDTVVHQHGQDIGIIKRHVNDIQNVQRKSVARQEARRLTAAIKDRIRRERAYDRLLDINMRRMENGQDPCVTIACEH